MRTALRMTSKATPTSANTASHIIVCLSSQQLAILVSFNARDDAHHFHRDRDDLDAPRAHDRHNTQLQLESYYG